MNRSWLVGGAGVVAATSAVFALGGPRPFFGGGGSGLDGAAGNARDRADAAARDAAGAAAGTGGAAGKPASVRGALLFGRPRAERKGVGALLARVVRWKDQTPVGGSQVFLSGEWTGG